MTILPKAIYRFDPYQITNGIFHRTRTKISQFIWKYKRPRIIKPVLRKTGAGGIDLLTSDYTTKIQSSRQDGKIQGNGTRQKSQEKTHTLMGRLFLTKEPRIYNGEKTACSINGSGKTGQLHVKE